MPTLYIVPTPIGNLEDITLRALRVLKSVTLVAAEDTRTSRKLLQHFDILTPLTSYHEHNKLTKLGEVFTALETGDVALISDAGTPGISDPGYELVQEAIRRGIPVVPLPGPNAITTALVGSGLPTDRFTFYGFPPRKQQALQTFLYDIAHDAQTLIFYESPHRLLETLYQMLDAWGDRRAVVAREMSKYYEEFMRDTLSNLADFYEANPPKGEITLVVHGAVREGGAWPEEQVRAAMDELLAEGFKRSKAAKRIAEESGWDRRDVYDLGQ